jgi:hypothetical protein
MERKPSEDFKFKALRGKAAARAWMDLAEVDTRDKRRRLELMKSN